VSRLNQDLPDRTQIRFDTLRAHRARQNIASSGAFEARDVAAGS